LLVVNASIRAVLCWLSIAAAPCVGCAPTVREASRGTASGLSQGLEEPGNRRRLLSAVEAPETQQAIRDIAADATSGVAGAMTDERTAAWVRQLADAVVDASMRRIARDLPQTVGPALGDMIRTQIAPSLRGAVSGPEMQAALSSTAYQMARQAVLGANDESAELSRAGAKKGPLGHLGATFREGGVLAVIGLAVFVCAIAALTFALLRTRAELRHYRAERRRDGGPDGPRSGAAAPA
jgi:hypothetical protein